MSQAKISSWAKKCPTRPIFDFMDLWALPDDFRFSVLLNYWKFPNEIVPYDTYIIFEDNLGAMLFARKISKNINTFWSLEAYIIVLTASYFIGLFFTGKIRLCAMCICKQFMKKVFSWRYERFLFYVNFISYHLLQFISVQIDSFRVTSDSIWMYVQIVFALCRLSGN